MSCRLFGAKTLLESMLTYRQLDIQFNPIPNSNIFVQEIGNVVAKIAAILSASCVNNIT